MKNNDKEKYKLIILKRFERNVKGKKPDTSSSNKNHDGKDGHWLETKMDIKHNSKNEPDLYGFEMKNQTTSKTTFGDWSADYYIYKDKEYGINRNDFLKIFGLPNKEKNMRHSWSGKSCPKIKQYNICGQLLIVDADNNINAIYSYSRDQRPNKSKIVPKIMQKENLIIATWSASKLQLKLEKKFNNNGWFQCKKDENGYYKTIVFGDPMNFNNWIGGVKKGLIFFDSGMYEGNKRPYSQWRADNKYWDSLITSRY